MMNAPASHHHRHHHHHQQHHHQHGHRLSIARQQAHLPPPPGHPSLAGTIDLHGLKKEEAIKKLTWFLSDVVKTTTVARRSYQLKKAARYRGRRNGEEQDDDDYDEAARRGGGGGGGGGMDGRATGPVWVVVVTGSGSHSSRGPIVRSVVDALLRKRDMTYVVNRGGGSFTVDAASGVELTDDPRTRNVDTKILLRPSRSESAPPDFLVNPAMRNGRGMAMMARPTTQTSEASIDETSPSPLPAEVAANDALLRHVCFVSVADAVKTRAAREKEERELKRALSESAKFRERDEEGRRELERALLRSLEDKSGEGLFPNDGENTDEEADEDVERAIRESLALAKEEADKMSSNCDDAETVRAILQESLALAEMEAAAREREAGEEMLRALKESIACASLLGGDGETVPSEEEVEGEKEENENGDNDGGDDDDDDEDAEVQRAIRASLELAGSNSSGDDVVRESGDVEAEEEEIPWGKEAVESEKEENENDDNDGGGGDDEEDAGVQRATRASLEIVRSSSSGDDFGRKSGDVETEDNEKEEILWEGEVVKGEEEENENDDNDGDDEDDKMRCATRATLELARSSSSGDDVGRGNGDVETEDNEEEELLPWEEEVVEDEKEENENDDNDGGGDDDDEDAEVKRVTRATLELARSSSSRDDVGRESGDVETEGNEKEENENDDNDGGGDDDDKDAEVQRTTRATLELARSSSSGDDVVRESGDVETEGNEEEEVLWEGEVVEGEKEENENDDNVEDAEVQRGTRATLELTRSSSAGDDVGKESGGVEAEEEEVLREKAENDHDDNNDENAEAQRAIRVSLELAGTSPPGEDMGRKSDDMETEEEELLPWEEEVLEGDMEENENDENDGGDENFEVQRAIRVSLELAGSSSLGHMGRKSGDMETEEEGEMLRVVRDSITLAMSESFEWSAHIENEADRAAGESPTAPAESLSISVEDEIRDIPHLNVETEQRPPIQDALRVNIDESRGDNSEEQPVVGFLIGSVNEDEAVLAGGELDATGEVSFLEEDDGGGDIIVFNPFTTTVGASLVP